MFSLISRLTQHRTAAGGGFVLRSLQMSFASRRWLTFLPDSALSHWASSSCIRTALSFLWTLYLFVHVDSLDAGFRSLFLLPSSKFLSYVHLAHGSLIILLCKVADARLFSPLNFDHSSRHIISSYKIFISSSNSHSSILAVPSGIFKRQSPYISKHKSSLTPSPSRQISNILLICCGGPFNVTPLAVLPLLSPVMTLAFLAAPGLLPLTVFGRSVNRSWVSSIPARTGNRRLAAIRTASISGLLVSCFLDTGILPISIFLSTLFIVGRPPPISDTFRAMRSCTLIDVLLPCNFDHQCGFFVMPISASI